MNMAGQEEKNKISQGRVSQKNRTRTALVAAARELMQGGKQSARPRKLLLFRVRPLIAISRHRSYCSPRWRSSRRVDRCFPSRTETFLCRKPSAASFGELENGALRMSNTCARSSGFLLTPRAAFIVPDTGDSGLRTH